MTFYFFTFTNLSFPFTILEISGDRNSSAPNDTIALFLPKKSCVARNTAWVQLYALEFVIAFIDLMLWHGEVYLYWYYNDANILLLGAT